MTRTGRVSLDLLSVTLFVLGWFVLTDPVVISRRVLPIASGFRPFGFPVVYAVYLGCALIGWRRVRATQTLARYLVWAVPLAVWVMASAVAAWDVRSYYRARMFDVWMVFIIPGLAYVLREARYRKALSAGLVVWAAMFASVALGRMALRRSPFDGGIDLWPTVLGINRNAVNVLMVVAFGLLLTKNLPRSLMAARLPLTMIIVVWTVLSGGRSGLIAIAVTGLAFAIFQPGSFRRIRVAYVVVVVCVAGVVLLPAIGGQAVDSSRRLIATIRGERSPGDPERELLLRRAWNVTSSSPVFGVGYGNFAGAYDPIVEEAETQWSFRASLDRGAHNSFAQLMAEAGIPALVFFLGLLAFAIRRGFERRRTSHDIRVFAALLAGIVPLMLFAELIHSYLFYLPLALLLGALVESELDDPLRPRIPSGHRGLPAERRMVRPGTAFEADVP